MPQPQYAMNPAVLHALRELAARCEKNICPMCGGGILGFRTQEDLAEFRISGLCQDCQDDFFGITGPIEDPQHYIWL